MNLTLKEMSFLENSLVNTDYTVTKNNRKQWDYSTLLDRGSYYRPIELEEAKIRNIEKSRLRKLMQEQKTEHQRKKDRYQEQGNPIYLAKMPKVIAHRNSVSPERRRVNLPKLF